jgi:thymidine kinase
MKGTLTVITGSMYGRKSLDLIEEIKSWEYQSIPYVAFSPIKSSITSRGSNTSIPAVHIVRQHAAIISYYIGSLIQKGQLVKAVAIDEVSFYDEGIVSVVDILLEEGIDVIVAGLDLDFANQPFGYIGDLMTMAVDVRKKYSVCMKCKTALATKTQRLLNGQPAPLDSPLIVVESETEQYTYECRCKDCYERSTLL